eukprot:TRINITY_DN620_c0_g1_i1.p1 TRINITY_DN620_c0_g1~~TRINITY_DN620_c0_g1_i1.p1  ORF type:complete len:470 (-),score=78.47 TRINITY_DN620_c0_g1_i1:39-1448(-)
MMVVSTLPSSSGSPTSTHSDNSSFPSQLKKFEDLQVKHDDTLISLTVGPSTPASSISRSSSSSNFNSLSRSHSRSPSGSKFSFPYDMIPPHNALTTSSTSSSDLETTPEKVVLRQTTPLLMSVPLEEDSDDLEAATSHALPPSNSQHLVDPSSDLPPLSDVVKIVRSRSQASMKASMNFMARRLNSLRNMSWQSAVRISVIAVLVIGIATFLGFLIGSNHVQTAMVDVLSWLSRLPKWAGSLLMIGMYCAGLMLFCPGTPFNLAAGFLFGMWIGVGVAMAGCMLGAGGAFFLGRTLARDWVKSKMDHRPKFKAVDWAIQKNGLYIIFLTRLSPLFPFPLLNYGFGITKVAIWQYVAGTFAGVVPATFAYTYLGTLMRNLTDMWSSVGGDTSSNTNIWWLVGGSVMTLVSIVVISLITKRAISKATREYEQQQQQLAETPVANIGLSVDDVKPESLPVVELEEITVDPST